MYQSIILYSGTFFYAGVHQTADKTRRLPMNDQTNTPDQKLSKKENTVQVIKFALFSVSAGIIQTLSFTLVNEIFNGHIHLAIL